MLELPATTRIRVRTDGKRLRDHAERGPPADGVRARSAAPPQADDVNFASPVAGRSRRARRSRTPGCTDPGGPGRRPQDEVDAQPVGLADRPTDLQSYPARKGHDQFYGYGRVNMARALSAVLPAASSPSRPRSRRRPRSPRRSGTSRSTRRSRACPVAGEVYARGAVIHVRGLVAPGEYPNNASHDRHAAGRLQAVEDSRLVRRHHRATPTDRGVLGTISVSPSSRTGSRPGPTSTAPSRGAGPTNDNGRPERGARTRSPSRSSPLDPERPRR